MAQPPAEVTSDNTLVTIPETEELQSILTNTEKKRKREDLQDRTEDRKKRKRNKLIACFSCNQKGHVERNCPSKEVTCTHCGHGGSVSRYLSLIVLM